MCQNCVDRAATSYSSNATHTTTTTSTISDGKPNGQLYTMKREDVVALLTKRREAIIAERTAAWPESREANMASMEADSAAYKVELDQREKAYAKKIERLTKRHEDDLAARKSEFENSLEMERAQHESSKKDHERTIKQYERKLETLKKQTAPPTSAIEDSLTKALKQQAELLAISKEEQIDVQGDRTLARLLGVGNNQAW